MARAADDTALIGRSSELRELITAVDVSRSGPGRFLLLTGDAGIGKTRLAEATAAAAEAAGVPVVWGRCREAGGGAPFGPWSEIVCAALAGAGSMPTRAVARLRQLLPELDGPPTNPPSELPGARLGAFNAVLDALAARAGDGGLVVVMEDLHAADDGTSRLLEFVLRRIRSRRLLLIGTSRAGEPALTGYGRRIHLTGFDEDGAAQLLERTAPRIVAGDLARRAVVHATDGNPFLVQEMAHLLDAEGQQSATVPLPADARQLIRRRLATVSADLRNLLNGAAVLGADFDVATLAALHGLPPDELADRIAAAVHVHILQEVAPGSWSFCHALLREALYTELRPSERASLHRRAGRAIEARPPSDRFRVAHHYFQAARDGAGEAAVLAGAAAGDAALASLAFEEAARQYGHALEALALAPPVDERRRYPLLVGLATAKARNGDLSQAGESWRRALQSARAIGAAEHLAEAALGHTAVASSRTGDTRSVLEEARAVLPPGDSGRRARLTLRLATRVPGPTGHDLAEQALSMARRLDDAETSWAVLSEWLAAAGSEGRRLEVARELLDLAEQKGDRARVALARQWTAGELFAAGDIAATVAQVVIATKEAEALDEPFLLWVALTQQAALALLQGRLDDAERLAGEARSAGDGIERPDVEAGTDGLLRRIGVERGRFDEVADLSRVALGAPGGRDTGCLRIDRARATLQVGRGDEAREVVAAADVARGRRCCLAGLAELCWLLDDAGPAGALYDLLLPGADSHLVAPEGGCSLGATARYLGHLATLLGRFDAAEAHFEAAHDLHERMGAPGWLARSRADHARMLVRRSSPGDLDVARSLAQVAADAFTAIGMEFDAAQARSIVEADGSKERGHGTTALDRARLHHDGEYWAFEYADTVVRLRDGKGVRYLVSLLRQPGHEVHALDLVGERTGVGGLDAAAKSAFRRRLEDLRDELDEAAARNDLGRTAQAQEDIDRLLAEASAAVAGGGSRADAERARQSVTRAVKGTIERLAEGNPALGLHLRSTVRTGVFSIYVPDPRAPIVWEEQ